MWQVLLRTAYQQLRGNIKNCLQTSTLKFTIFKRHSLFEMGVNNPTKSCIIESLANAARLRTWCSLGGLAHHDQQRAAWSDHDKTWYQWERNLAEYQWQRQGQRIRPVSGQRSWHQAGPNLLNDRPTPDRTNEEGSALPLGRTTSKSIQNTQITYVLSPNSTPTSI